MKITVYGAGGIGGYLAARLAQTKFDVTLIARGATLSAIRQNGICLEIGDRLPIIARVQATDDISRLGPQDIVITAIKQPDLPSIARHLAAMTGDQTAVVFAVNGIPWWYDARLTCLDPSGELEQLVPLRVRVGCVLQLAAEAVAPGVIRSRSFSRDGAGFISLGVPRGGDLCRANDAASALAAAGIFSSVNADLAPAIWSKLLMNVALSVTATLASAPVSAVVAEPHLAKLARELAMEVHAIASALGIKGVCGPEALDSPALKNWSHRPSMLQDFEAGRSLEIEGLLTSPLLLAERCGVPAPNLRMVRARLWETTASKAAERRLVH